MLGAWGYEFSAFCVSGFWPCMFLGTVCLGLLFKLLVGVKTRSNKMQTAVFHDAGRCIWDAIARESVQMCLALRHHHCDLKHHLANWVRIQLKN